jgi:sugar/nucleoside kinase (ribokinase family)
MSYDVFGIGNALVDLQVKVSDGDLEELMLPKGGMALTSAEEQARLLEAIGGRVDNVCSGGSAANTMHGIGALGGKAYYLGRVANDEYGRHYTGDMEECGVGFPGPDATPSGTGTSVVLVTPDAQRTLATHLGISVELHPDNVDPSIVAESKMVYIEGYLWDAEDPRRAAILTAEIANQAGIPVAFTISDAFLIDRYREDLLAFINHHVDVLFCNEVEGRELAENKQTSVAFAKISGLVARLFFTLSDKGAWVAHEGDEPTAVRPFPAESVDTTGAGDLFAAGALYGLTHGHSLEECAILGNYCGSRIVSRFGARLPERLAGKLDPIFAEYHSKER